MVSLIIRQWSRATSCLVVRTSKPSILASFGSQSPLARRMTSVARTKSLDHVVLTVKDIDVTVKFYKDVLGMEHTSFSPASAPDVKRHALAFGEQKINLHLAGREFEPKAQNVQVGSGDLCFLVEDDVEGVVGRLKDKGIEVLEGGGVVDRTGARGKLRSVYIRDPDGNLVE
jgi:catechol 2,3-dioxygenase-like lactoylglutathione lyase family enzyme